MIILKIGDTGPYVEMLQLALKRSGEFESQIDGIFGPVTQEALKEFQRKNGLVADGIMGNLTFNKLKKYISGYLSVTLRKGETAESLAKTYNSTTELIKTANPGIDLSKPAANDGLKVIVPLNVALATSEISYTNLLTNLISEGLAARYPFLNRFSYGRSVMGRSLNGIQIGNGKNQLMVNASHHANEWITTPLLLRFTENYAKAISKDGKIGAYDAKKLFDKTALTVLPLVNPDGVDLVTGAIPDTSPVYESAEGLNYPRLPFPSGWKANISGTDLNLNYPAGWEIAKKIKYEQGFTSPAPRDFVGDYPLSAPESRAVYNLTLRNSFLLTLSYHTQGKTIYWKYADYLPEYSEEIARFFSEQSGYSYEETPFASGNAGYKDWFIKKYNRPGYTIEAGAGINPLPLSQFDEIYKDNLGILAGAVAIVSHC